MTFPLPCKQPLSRLESGQVPSPGEKETMKLYQVNQRLVVATQILIEAKNKSEAKKLAAAFVTKEITKAIKEESAGSDRAEIEDIEVTNCQPTLNILQS